MSARNNPFPVVALAISFVLSGSVASAQAPFPALASGPTSTEAGVVNETVAVLQELTSGTVTAIPENLLASAEAIAIVPHFVRGAFVIGIAGGRGVLVQRDAAKQWKSPEFITLRGGSVGWQIGVQATDLVLVFLSARSLENIQRGKITLGVDASAAAGPVGRYAGAATDAGLQAEILTYSRTRGLYAGVSLGGSGLQLDVPATQRYYQITPTSPGVVPPSAFALVNELNRFNQTSGLANRISPESLQPLRESSAPPLSLDQPGETIPRPITPNPIDTAAQDKRARTINDLAIAIAALQPKVDAQWQQYLVLPASWKVPATVTANDIHSILVRYERVATNPQFAALSQQPEFMHALQLLRQLATDAANDSTLTLPPPPIQR